MPFRWCASWAGRSTGVGEVIGAGAVLLERKCVRMDAYTLSFLRAECRFGRLALGEISCVDGNEQLCM